MSTLSYIWRSVHSPISGGLDAVICPGFSCPALLHDEAQHASGQYIALVSTLSYIWRFGCRHLSRLLLPCSVTRWGSTRIRSEHCHISGGLDNSIYQSEIKWTLQPFQAWVYHCHLHPLQAANCCRNSQLIVDEDELKWVKNWRNLPCIGKPVSWKFSF